MDLHRREIESTSKLPGRKGLRSTLRKWRTRNFRSQQQRKCPRWLPTKSEAAKVVTTWLEKHLPPTIKLVCDDYNGRWRVISEAELIWRSVSWTKRGYAKAASLVLHTAWTFHFDATGEQPEFDIDELEKDFAEAEE